MLLLSTAVLMVTMQMSYMQLGQAVAAESGDAASQAIRHRQAVLQWVAGCILFGESGESDYQNCQNAPPNNGTNTMWQPIAWAPTGQINDTVTNPMVIELTIANMQARGVDGLNPNWRTFYWRHGASRAVFFLLDTGGTFNAAAMEQIQALSYGSPYHGTLRARSSSSTNLIIDASIQELNAGGTRYGLSLPDRNLFSNSARPLLQQGNYVMYGALPFFDSVETN